MAAFIRTITSRVIRLGRGTGIRKTRPVQSLGLSAPTHLENGIRTTQPAPHPGPIITTAIPEKEPWRIRGGGCCLGNAAITPVIGPNREGPGLPHPPDRMTPSPGAGVPLPKGRHSEASRDPPANLNNNAARPGIEFPHLPSPVQPRDLPTCRPTPSQSQSQTAATEAPRSSPASPGAGRPRAKSHEESATQSSVDLHSPMPQHRRNSDPGTGSQRRRFKE